MARAGAAIAGAVACALAAGVLPAAAAEQPTFWDGTNPFSCVLQQAGFGPTGPDPEADPYCVEFDKRRQNVAELGAVDFLMHEPARVAAASPKCFYFQSDHWRGSLVQDVDATKTYEWDGHYFFDKATGDGGVWVSNFNVAGQTQNPGELPGMPPEYAQHFGPGEGGTRSHNAVETDPRCAEQAEREGEQLYAGAPPPRCMTAGGGVSRTRLGPVRLGASEAEVRRTLGPPGRVKRGFLRWCVAGGGRFLVGQRTDRSGELGEGRRERTLMLLSTSPAFRYRGAGPGTRVRALRRALPRARRILRRGNTDILLARPRSRLIFAVHRGRVRFIALRDRRALRGKRALSRYLRRAR